MPSLVSFEFCIALCFVFLQTISGFSHSFIIRTLRRRPRGQGLKKKCRNLTLKRNTFLFFIYMPEMPQVHPTLGPETVFLSKLLKKRKCRPFEPRGRLV